MNWHFERLNIAYGLGIIMAKQQGQQPGDTLVGGWLDATFGPGTAAGFLGFLAYFSIS
jgi:hypothetical protein